MILKTNLYNLLCNWGFIGFKKLSKVNQIFKMTASIRLLNVMIIIRYTSLQNAVNTIHINV